MTASRLFSQRQTPWRSDRHGDAELALVSDKLRQVREELTPSLCFSFATNQLGQVYFVLLGLFAL